MKYYVNKLIVLMIVLCFTAFGLFAGESTAYTHEELGFSLSFPTDWEIEEIELGAIISSIPDFFNFEEDGAGIALFITPIENMSIEEMPQSNKDVWEALKNNDDSIEEKSVKNIEWFGKEWLVAEFYEQTDNCHCVFYFLLDGDLVYLVGCIYHPPESLNSYEHIVEEIIKSIRYSNIEEK
ncbi:MAG: hypothetical protein JW822_09100 [Spirochaetales bacterium]|nr:hypothetical protein [Spirochaetales bacterium]